MKPDFALNLSFDGITLLQRVTGGWAELGTAGFDGDLGEAMNSLRATAEATDPDGANVKLIVPNDQIKYLDVPADGTWDEDRVQTALDGATPYPVDQLKYDWAETAGQVHIAAVAHDTLQEAEAFALEHGFRPASFVAIPPAGAFGREVFLGQSDSWTGAAQTGPEDAIVIVPMPETPEPVVEPEPAPEPEAEPEVVAEEATDEVATEATTQDEPEVAPEVDAPEVAPEAEAEVEAAIDEPAEPIKDPAAPEAVEASDAAPEPEVEPAPEAEPAPAATKAPAPTAPVTAAIGTASAQVFASVRDAPPSTDAPSDLAKTEPKLSITTQNLRVTDGAIADAPAPKLGAADAGAGDAQTGSAPKIAAPDATPQDSAPAPVLPSAGKAPQLKAEPIDRTSPKLDEPPVATTSSLTKPRPETAQPAKAEQKKGGFGFFTRRSKTAAVMDQPAPEPVAAMVAEDAPAPVDAIPETKKSRRAKKQEAKKAAEERDRLTIFGARNADVKVGGKPRFLGLMLTTLLLLFLAGVAAWASVFLDDGLARFFREDATNVAALPEELIEDAAIDAQPEMADDAAIKDESQEFEVAALTDPEDTASDITEGAPELPTALSEPIRYAPLTEEEALATYAATGIWLRGPSMPALITTRSTDDVYSPSIDPNVEQHDAVALPATLKGNERLGFDAPISPLPANTVFKLDDRGLVIATLEGALNPDGVRIFSGQPPTIPPLRGSDGQVLVPSTNDTDSEQAGIEQAALEPLTETLKRLQGLTPVRPSARPADIIEQNERANFAGRTLSELAKLRPLARPNSPQQDTTEDVEATAQAIVASLHPMPRPRDISSIVSKAQKAPTPAAPQQVAAVAPRTVKPAAPSSTSVAKQATVKNALNLRKINLIGVYGQPSSRRALVRLGNGQYKKVKVGDRIDGGRVSAIGESELRYTKGGRSISLKMPKG